MSSHISANDSITLRAGGPLRGRLRVPGDKSISHRALLFSALAEGRSTIRGLSSGDDVLRTRIAIESMGVKVSVQNYEDDKDGAINLLTVDGGRSLLRQPNDVIDLRNSGTGMRLLAGFASGLPWTTTIDGDESLRKRPMNRVAQPLRDMGATIELRDGNWAPITITGGLLRGINYTPPVASAQLKSAVLIAGLAAEGETVVHEPVATRAHTEEMLMSFGAAISVEDVGEGTRIVLQPSQLHPVDVDVPGDPSQAAFWMVAAAIVPDSDVVIENIYLGPGRGGVVEALARMGADIDIDYLSGHSANVRVRYSKLHGTEIGGDEIPSLIDELPVMSLAAAMADGQTTVSDAEEMRVKESDRVSAVAKEIGGLGMKVTERQDGFVINGQNGKQLFGGEVNAELDHRIAMSAAIAALVSENPVKINGWESVSTSYPSFLADLASLRGEEPRGEEANV